jgi:hypothetical protein
MDESRAKKAGCKILSTYSHPYILRSHPGDTGPEQRANSDLG